MLHAFALDRRHACERCVFATGEHAVFCPELQCWEPASALSFDALGRSVYSFWLVPVKRAA